MSTTSLTGNAHALDVLLVLHPGEDDSPTVNATLLVCDNGAALVAELPPDTEDEAGGRMPTAEVYCMTSQSFFDVIRCGDDFMAFPTSPALRDADDRLSRPDLSETEDAEGELLGHVGVDSGVVMIGDPCYGEGEKPGALMESIIAAAETATEVCTPQGDLGGIAVPTPFGDGVFPVFAQRDSDGRIVRLTVEF